jgi:glycosyltransferase involved in cell wall biosynthesis
VATRIVREVIEDGVTGFIVDSEAEAIDAIGRIRCLDRRRIRKRFEQRFTARRMAHDYVDSYRRLATPVPYSAGHAQPGRKSLEVL